MSKLREIVDGHLNELGSALGLTNEDSQKVFRSREKVCNHCPLKSGNTCNPGLYINPKTLETSSTAKAGFHKGCGCRLSAKQKSPNSVCPAGFWGGEFNKK